MAREWDAEHEVDAALAARLVAVRFPHLAGAPVEPLEAGWDNTVHLVDGCWAFRFPRRTVALAGVARETAVLPRLAPVLPLPVPVPELLGRPTADFPWPFTGSRFLPGTELAEADLPDAGRTAVAAQLGAFLAALHDPVLAERLGDGLPTDPNARADPRARAQRSLPWLERLFDAGAWPGDPAVHALFAEAAPLGPSSDAPVLVHGDLHVRHVLVDAGRACGVIDWGDVCLADPGVDLAVAYSAFAGPARTAFLDAYGRVDTATELRARVLAVSLSAALADWALAERRPRLLAEALRGLERAVGG